MKKLIAFSLCIAMLSSAATSFAAADNTDTAVIGSADEATSIMITDSENTAPPTETPAETESSETETTKNDATTEPHTETSTATTDMPSETPTPDPVNLSNVVNVNIAPKALPRITGSEVKLELYSTDKELLADQSQSMTADTTELNFVFEVPQYEIGTDFILKLTDGLMCVQYYENTYNCGQEFTIETFTITIPTEIPLSVTRFHFPQYPILRKI